MHGALVGNKCDLDLRRTVSASEAEETAANLGIPYFECSAKEGVQVDEPFYFLANCLYEQYIEQTQEFQNIADAVWGDGCCVSNAGIANRYKMKIELMFVLTFI